VSSDGPPASRDSAGPAPAAPRSGPVGLIAGRGALPLAIAEGARRQGHRIVCVNAFDAEPRLGDVADAYYTVGLGELGGMVEAFHRHGVREIVLAGKVDKLAAANAVRLDALGMRVASRLTDLRDASILGALVAVLEESGFTVAPQARYVGHLVPEVGVLGRRAPSPEEHEDITLGARIAAGIAALDVGQTVAVRHGMVVTVEAAEGTDAMIRRAGGLASGVVVVKVSRPDQDPRYDLPAVGPQTVGAIAEVRGTALAIEAGRTILLERGRLVARADAAGIAVVALAAPAGA